MNKKELEEMFIIVDRDAGSGDKAAIYDTIDDAIEHMGSNNSIFVLNNVVQYDG